MNADDDDLLLRAYTSTRDDVLGVGWSEAQRREFVELQYRAQRADYEQRFPASEHSIIVVDGKPGGRIWIDRRADEIRLLDLTVLPEYRNHGVGYELLERLIAEARRAGVALRHSVLATNLGALRFYARLGFEVIDDVGMHVLMQLRPDRAPISRRDG